MTNKMTNRDFLSDVVLLTNNFLGFEIKHTENKFIEFYRQSVFKFFLRKDTNGYALRVSYPSRLGDSYIKTDTLSLELSKKDIEKLKKIIEELSL